MRRAGPTRSRKRSGQAGRLLRRAHQGDVDQIGLTPLRALGRYSFTASTPAVGALRPLRDPDAPERDEDDDGGPECVSGSDRINP
ncbi:hypothetical protein DEJ50_00545 [Streptomyces venezuelae]|uniref:Uncharacterized protein n=1 Tax=Streptomyces venezuelae TaxID=54571 RepID=A0A5P2CUG2_STRVZ|nr:hypothetical protein [Streptomyces venezuelae]QES46564.1 hypothetical protein DEJ50_00545 [Streptomyces venezuelae]